MNLTDEPMGDRWIIRDTRGDVDVSFNKRSRGWLLFWYFQPFQILRQDLFGAHLAPIATSASERSLLPNFALFVTPEQNLNIIHCLLLYQYIIYHVGDIAGERNASHRRLQQRNATPLGLE